MRKIQDVSLERKNMKDKLETSRNLYRVITEVAKKLEEQKNHALTVMDIFTPAGEALRIKLRDHCEKLLTVDPIHHVQKVEEILWRRGFYDVVNIAKKLQKKNQWTEKEEAFIITHFLVGIGYYNHLMLNLLKNYNLQLRGIIDFFYPIHQTTVIVLEKKDHPSNCSENEKKCILRFIHRCLICLGDLARYKLDFEPNWDPEIAVRYYKLAIALDPKLGMPHNQLGTIFTNKNFGLDAVYYYMRSSLCNEPFESAETNLKRAIAMYRQTKVSDSTIHSCIIKLFRLLQLWDDETGNYEHINQESQSFLNDFEECLNIDKIDQKTDEIDDNEENLERYLVQLNLNKVDFLSDEMIFKMLLSCIMMIERIKARNSKTYSSTLALMLAMMSQLMQFVVIHLQELLLDMVTNSPNEDVPTDKKASDDQLETNENECPNISAQNSEGNVNTLVKKTRNKSKNLLTKLRRRRNQGSSSDSSFSDEEPNVVLSSSDENNTDGSESEGVVSEDEPLSDVPTDEEGNSTKEDDTLAKTENIEATSETENKAQKCETQAESKKTANKENVGGGGNISCDKNTEDINKIVQMRKRFLDPIKILNTLKAEKNLMSIKIFCDWLEGHPDIIKTYAKGSKSMLKCLVTLLNLINMDFERVIKTYDKSFEIFANFDLVPKITETIPLPEETDLRGLQLFDNFYQKLDWDFLKGKKLNSFEETMLRSLKIMQFGHYLCTIKDVDVTFDSKLKLFILSESDTPSEEANNLNNDLKTNQSKGRLMRHMGKLWLKAEVKALENRVHSRLMSPYLVPDHEAFFKHMPLLKNLVYAKKFIVVIPLVVVTALDEMKRSSVRSREATRWLEAQLKRGSRFLRFQRPHETSPLPYIKGPKSKDKEAWMYFQIIECCHYLTQQNKADASDIPIVTLLTGVENRGDTTFNPKGLAESASINLEHIKIFHTKWKSTKHNGRK